MPLATLHLISLTQKTTVRGFLKSLQSSDLRPLVISRVIRWIIRPERIEVKPLLHPSKAWDLLLITAGTDGLPVALKKEIECHWTTTAGIPSRLTKDFSETNSKLLFPDIKSIPELTGSLDNPRVGESSQTLELSPDLQSWVTSFSKSHSGSNAVSMLNLLAFKPEMKSSYLIYGKAFAESIGSKRGGNAKLVGNIVHPESSKKESVDDEIAQSKWDEFALAHYPSITHFADMLASEDYQAINLKYRVPALQDTCILCTSEIEIEEILKGGGDMGIGQRAMEKREIKL